MGSHPLSTILILPFIGVITLLFVHNKKKSAIKTISAIVVGLQLWLSLQIFFNFDTTTNYLQFVDHYSWINLFSIDFIIGINGLNLPFVLLSSIVLFLSIFISWNLEHQQKTFYMLLMIFDFGIMGIFIAFDLFLFISFLGILLFSTFFLISLFTSDPQKNPAIHFGIYAIIAFSLILIGTLLISSKSDLSTFNITHLIQNPNPSNSFQIIGYFILLTGFLFITPIIPFHSWYLPTVSNTIAPINILIMSLFTKIGLFGILKLVFPLFPYATRELTLIIGILALISILYYALCAFSYKSYRTIITYFSSYQIAIAFLGLSSVLSIKSKLMGAAATGLNGAIIQMFGAGLIIPILVLLPKLLHNISMHKPGINDLPGRNRWIISFVIMLSLLASFGIPGFLSFISQFLCFLGIFQIVSTRIIGIIAFIGIIFIAVTFFKIIRSIVLNNNDVEFDVNHAETSNEFLIATVLVGLLILFGLYPKPLLQTINQSVQYLVSIIAAI